MFNAISIQFCTLVRKSWILCCHFECINHVANKGFQILYCHHWNSLCHFIFTIPLGFFLSFGDRTVMISNNVFHSKLVKGINTEFPENFTTTKATLVTFRWMTLMRWSFTILPGTTGVRHHPNDLLISTMRQSVKF